MKGIYRSSLVLLLAGMIVLSGCNAAATPAAAQEATPLPPVEVGGQVMADGQVVPVQSATLSFTTSGVISEVLVEEGQPVEAGQVIARLSGSEQIQASIASAQFELLSAQQELTDLEANAELALAQAQLKVAEAEKALDKATKKRASRNYKYGNQEQIDIAWADYVVAQETVKHAEEAYNGVAYQANDNPTKAGALSALAAARQARDRALANYNYLLALPNELEVNEADAQLMLAQAELNAAQEELQRVENGADAQKVELAQARIVNAQAQLAAAEARLAEVELEAPFTGTLVSSSLKVGELVSPGSPEVVLGNLSQWQVETLDLTEINVVGIQPEMPVVVQIDALPELELTGKVVRVKERGENRQGDIVYAVLIALDEQDERLRWNMTASVRFGE